MGSKFGGIAVEQQGSQVSRFGGVPVQQQPKTVVPSLPTMGEKVASTIEQKKNQVDTYLRHYHVMGRAGLSIPNLSQQLNKDATELGVDLSSIRPDTLIQWAKDEVGDMAWMLDTPPGKFLMKELYDTARGIADVYGKVKKKYPHQVIALETAGALAGTTRIGTKVPTKLPQRDMPSWLTKLVTPYQSAPVAKANVKGRLNEVKGVTERIVTRLTDEQIEIAKAIEKVPGIRGNKLPFQANYTRSYNQVYKHIADTSDDLLRQLDAAGGNTQKSIIRNRIINAIKQVHDNDIINVDTTGALPNRIINQVSSMMEKMSPLKKPITSADVMRTRMALDDFYTSQKAKLLEDGQSVSRLSSYYRAARNELNNIVDTTSPGVMSREIRLNNHNLFKGLDLIEDNAIREVRTMSGRATKATLEKLPSRSIRIKR